MIKKQKIFVLILKTVVFLVALVGVSYYLLQQGEPVKQPAAYQSQTSLGQATNQSSIQPGLYRAVYSTCSNGYTDVYVYNFDIDKTEKVFSDKDKEYSIPCDLTSINHGTIENNALSFDAKDKKTGKDLKLSVDLGNKSEEITPYDPLDQSAETENIKKVGDLNVILSTVKKSPDGSKILFATDSQGLFVASANYRNPEQVNDFPGSKCVNKGNQWEAFASGWGWISDGKIFINDSALQCSGNGSFILDSDGKNPVKAADSIVVVPQQKALTDNNFVAIANDGTGNRIVLINVDTGKIAKEMIKGTQITVSLDGSKMFYEVHSGEDLNKPGSLFVADITGANYKNVPAAADGLIHIIGWMR